MIDGLPFYSHSNRPTPLLGIDPRALYKLGEVFTTKLTLFPLPG